MWVYGKPVDTGYTQARRQVLLQEAGEGVRSNEETDQTCARGASLKGDAGTWEILKIRLSEPEYILCVLKAV